MTEDLRNVTRIGARDLKAVQLLHLTSQGKSITDAANSVGMSRPRASKLINSRVGQLVASAVVEEVNIILQNRLPVLLDKALSELESILESKFVGADKRIKAAALVLKISERITESHFIKDDKHD